MGNSFYTNLLPPPPKRVKSDEIGHQPHHLHSCTFLLLNNFLNTASRIQSDFYTPTPLFNHQAINRAQKLPVIGSLLSPYFIYPRVPAKGGKCLWTLKTPRIDWVTMGKTIENN